MEDDFMAELTHHMAHFLLQDNDNSLDFSGSCYQYQTDHNFEQFRDLTGSPESTLWSREGSSEESSPPDTPADYETQSSNSSDTGFCSYDSLIQEQIRAIELSRIKEEGVLHPKQKPATCQEGEGKKKDKGGGGGGDGRRSRPRPGSQTQQQGVATGASMRALFIGGSGSIGGTGVFLPRGAPTESTKKQGKGCSVLIPARVVQALQQHYDKTAATMSGPKAVAFPPLHDVLGSKRDGTMYSLQSRKAPANVQNDEMTLPPEWTY